MKRPVAPQVVRVTTTTTTARELPSDELRTVLGGTNPLYKGGGQSGQNPLHRNY